jgi:CTP synthase
VSALAYSDNIISTQFHPELTARPLVPHPIFTAFIKAAIDNK